MKEFIIKHNRKVNLIALVLVSLRLITDSGMSDLNRGYLVFCFITFAIFSLKENKK